MRLKSASALRQLLSPSFRPVAVAQATAQARRPNSTEAQPMRDMMTGEIIQLPNIDVSSPRHVARPVVAHQLRPRCSSSPIPTHPNVDHLPPSSSSDTLLRITCLPFLGLLQLGGGPRPSSLVRSAAPAQAAEGFGSPDRSRWPSGAGPFCDCLPLCFHLVC